MNFVCQVAWIYVTYINYLYFKMLYDSLKNLKYDIILFMH